MPGPCVCVHDHDFCMPARRGRSDVVHGVAGPEHGLRARGARAAWACTSMSCRALCTVYMEQELFHLQGCAYLQCLLASVRGKRVLYSAPDSDTPKPGRPRPPENAELSTSPSCDGFRQNIPYQPVSSNGDPDSATPALPNGTKNFQMRSTTATPPGRWSEQRLQVIFTLPLEG